MNLNYAIFRSEPIMTVNDLAQIGSHNKHEKKAYNSNPDIDIERNKDNIELVPLSDKYVKGFYNLVKDYIKEHKERQKTEREDIKDWADTCMEFVYNDLGYAKEQVLHSVVHLDEKTPHIHCVVVPLIKKFDKRTNTERYTISKKQFIRDKIHLSELQDKYHARLVSRGYDLERGIKGSDRKHIKIKDYKKINRKLEENLNIRNNRLDKAINEFDEKMKSTKNMPFNKNQVIVTKNTFDTMEKIVKESKKVIELQPKINEVFQEINSYDTGVKEKINNLYDLLDKIKPLSDDEYKVLYFSAPKGNIREYGNYEELKECGEVVKEFINTNSTINVIRLSSKNFGFKNNIKFVPLYTVFCINKNSLDEINY